MMDERKYLHCRIFAYSRKQKAMFRRSHEVVLEVCSLEFFGEKGTLFLHWYFQCALLCFVTKNFSVFKINRYLIARSEALRRIIRSDNTRNMEFTRDDRRMTRHSTSVHEHDQIIFAFSLVFSYDETHMSEIHKLIIIGSGPAGITAALYAARADLAPIVLLGKEPGGQLMTTTDVENYPGFPEGIQGPELMQKFMDQAKRFGAKLVSESVVRVDFSSPPHKVYVSASVGEKEYRGEAVIVATGASAMWLGLESEARLRGRGVSSCATCDGAFFRNKSVVVVGGGDTALEEALFLTKFSTKVTVVHRRDALRASKIMQDRAFGNSKIAFIWNVEVIEVLGSQKVESVKLRDTKTGAESIFPCEGLFIAIGHKPNTDAGSGCKAAMDAERWLEERTSHSV